MPLRLNIRTEIREFKTCGLTDCYHLHSSSQLCLNEHVGEQLSQLTFQLN